MLDEKRIKEAQANVKSYLSEGLMRKVPVIDQITMDVLVKNSRESLQVAKILFNNSHSDMWTIVCSYYSMFYMANAVLYKNGYKIGEKISHKITADSLIVYIRDKLKKTFLSEALDEALDLASVRSDEIITSFNEERVKRGRIQYNTSEQAKRSKAQTSLERAEKFVFEMEKLL